MGILIMCFLINYGYIHYEIRKQFQMPEVKFLDIILPFRRKHFPLEQHKVCSKLAKSTQKGGKGREKGARVHLRSSYQWMYWFYLCSLKCYVIECLLGMAIKFMCRLLKQHSCFIGTLRSMDFPPFRHLLLLYIFVLYFFYWRIKPTDVFQLKMNELFKLNRSNIWCA